MARHRDLEDMIEILNLAIVRQETEEQFFMRSARDSTSVIAKQLFSEIGADLNKYRENLEERREKLVNALNDLKVAEKQAGVENKDAGKLEVEDPVCNMKINPKTCNFVSTYAGKEYSFCSEDCKKAFDVSPEKYAPRGGK